MHAVLSKIKDRLAVFNDATLLVWLPKLAGGDPALTMDDKVKELGQRIDAKRTEAQGKWKVFDDLRQAYANAGADTSEESDNFKKAEEAHKEYATLADELATLESMREQAWAMTAERGKTEAGSPQRTASEEFKSRLEQQRVSHGQRIVAGELFKAAIADGVFNRSQKSKLGEVQLGQMMDRTEFHAVITGGSDTSAGAFVQPDNRGFRAQPDAPIFITDLITVSETDSDLVEYVKETGFTNNAAAVPEATTDEEIDGSTVTAEDGGRKPQSDIAYEKVTEAVVNLAHWIATTRRAVADVAQLRSMIDGRLRYGLAAVLQDQIINGDGTDENLTGIYNTSGIQTQAKGSDSLLDASHKAITKIRLAFLEPTGIGYHPLDWEGIRLAKNANGDYLYGPPALAGAQTVWGLPPVVQPAFGQGNPLVGDYRQAELWLREGVTVLASDSHADFFIRNLLALLAEMRVAFGVPIPEAFCEVTSA